MAHEFITSYTFNGSENSVSLTNIPQTYKDLQLHFKFASATASYNLFPYIKVDGWTGSDFYNNEMRATPGGTFHYQNLEYRILLYGGETDASGWTAGTVDILDYTRDSGHSIMQKITNGDFFTSQIFTSLNTGTVGNITQLEIIASFTSSQYFKSGSKVWLYGIGEA